MAGIIPDQKDWTFVLKERCAECGQDVRAVTFEDIVEELPERVQRLQAVLDRAGARQRPSPQRWSDQEYVAHVAQMLQVMVQRFNLMLCEDDPTFPNWDQDQAAEQGDYNGLDTAQAGHALQEAASRFSTRLDGISPQDYHRRGLRSNGGSSQLRV